MKKQRGLTLVEILIALVLGLFVIAATLTIYINTLRSSSDSLNSTRLNHDLTMSISLMSNDIKRAGYWGAAKVDSNGFDNLFNVEAVAPAISTNLQVRNLAAPTTAAITGDCILYSYDADMDGVVDANEFYGFRLEDDSIKMRLNGTTTNDCSDGSWQTMSDENVVEVTDMKFSLTHIDSSTGAACANLTDATCLAGVTRCLNYETPDDPPAEASTTDLCPFSPAPTTNDKIAQKREVNIILTGRLKNDTIVTKSLTGTVVVRNDRLFRQP